MPRLSAGILMYRRAKGGIEVLLVHPGGPFWARRDLGAWSIPKGEHTAEEEPESAARREFREETGAAPTGALLSLGRCRQPSGKVVTAFALEGDFDIARLRSNDFDMEWPPRSGAMRRFPEVDRAEWFDLSVARGKIAPGQRPFLQRLEALRIVSAGPPASAMEG